MRNKSKEDSMLFFSLAAIGLFLLMLIAMFITN